MFDPFVRFMASFIDLITSDPVIYICYSVLLLWVFGLFFRIIRNR